MEGQLRNLHPMQQHARRVHRARAGARRRAGFVTVLLLLGTGMVGALIVASIEPGAARSAATFDGDDGSSWSQPASWIGSYHVRSVPIFRHRGGSSGTHSRGRRP